MQNTQERIFGINAIELTGGGSIYTIWTLDTRMVHPGTYIFARGISKAHGTQPIFHGYVPWRPGTDKVRHYHITPLGAEGQI